MRDRISREDAIDAIERKAYRHTYIEQIVDIINALPSAERTGRWTHVYDENEKLFFRNKWVCSACGKSNTYGMSDFCPCCGARMENSTRRMKEAEA